MCGSSKQYPGAIAEEILLTLPADVIPLALAERICRALNRVDPEGVY